LPYLEEGAVKGLIRTTQLREIPIALYNCPSRRNTTFHQSSGISLVDYAATVAGPARSEIGDAEFNKYLNDPHPTYPQFVSKQADVFWGCPGCPASGGRGLGDLKSKYDSGQIPKFRGIIQRSDWMHSPNPGRHIGFGVKMTFAKINDGASKTMMVSEKWVHVSKYLGSGGQADDRGWSDGWDFDALRSTMIKPRSDSTDPVPNDGNPDDPGNYPLGSAHSGGVNALFGDASVQFISYEVDLENLNRMANRLDGETVTESL
jgi:prepilin-type processing-associated H-X9-DG protein